MKSHINGSSSWRKIVGVKGVRIMNERILRLIQELSKVRLYSACGVMNGIRVGDNQKVYELVKEARFILDAIKEQGTEDPAPRL